MTSWEALTFMASTTAMRSQESQRRWREGFPGAASFCCKAETNPAWGSHLRSVTWFSEVLREVWRPCSVDKAHTLCRAEDSVYVSEQNTKCTYFFCTVSLPSCEECDPPPSFFLSAHYYSVDLQLSWICLRNPDANPSDLWSELLF